MRRALPPRERGRQIAFELTGLNQVVHEAAADPESLGDRGLVQPLVQEVFEQHEGIPSVHRRPIPKERGATWRWAGDSSAPNEEP